MDAVFVTLISVLLLLLLVLWISQLRKLESWKQAGIPCPKAWPIFGNYAPFILQQKISGIVAQDICRRFPDAPCIATYYGTELALLIQDPELIKTVLLKDFVYFNGREVSEYTDREFSTRSLFFTYGDRWKVIRQNITPLFTSAKIKSMFTHVRKCNYMFEDLLEYLAKSDDVTTDIKDLMTRYTMDNVCSIGYGVDTNTLATDCDPKNPFLQIGRLLFENSFIRTLAVTTRAIWPAIFYGLGLKVFPDIISNFFKYMLMNVFENRNHEPSLRNDFVDMVLNLKKMDTIECESILKDGIVSIKLDDDFLVAQCIVFFAAGFETSSTTLSFTLYELAKNRDVQDKVIKEIDSWLKTNGNKLDYSCVTGLPYLEACVDETLRLYPIQPLLARETMVDCELGGIKVAKGTRIHIPVYHVHRKEEYYHEPLKLNPERFLGENRQFIQPYTYLPFGEGNRICVGIRVARMMMMPCLVTLLKRFRVELAPGVPQTVTLDPRAFTVQCKEDIKLRLIPRARFNQVQYDRSLS